MRVLLYGGSFDPPHYGHMNNLRAAAARVRPDRVVVMPAGVSPFKQGTTASGPLRVEMCGCFAALARELGFGLEVTSRNVGDDPALHAKARQLDKSGSRILFAPVEALPMASSTLRARLAAGEECEKELPASVRRVIRREGLYTKGDEVTNESETGKRACAQPAE